MKLKQAYILCLLLFGLLCFLLPQAGEFDTGYWVAWAWNLKRVGFAHAYSIEGLNYNPLYLYVLKAYSTLFPTFEGLFRNIAYLKLVTLLFDFGAVLLLMNWLNKHGRDFFVSFFILINIGYLYNTLYWGQVDAIYTTLVFAAIVATLEKRLLLSMALFLIALNTKTQSIVFVVPLLLLWFPQLIGKGRQIIKSVGVLVLIQTVIILPFLLNGTAINVWNNFIGVANYTPNISLHAYNFWYLALWENTVLPATLPDTGNIAGYSYRGWGYLLFFTFSFIVLLPLFLSTIVKVIKRKQFEFENAEPVVLTLALIALFFFYFPTQMHERYSHPAILFSGIYFVFSGRWLIFVLICYSYTMNLEVLDKCWHLNNYKTTIFDARLIAALYALAIVLGIFSLYKSYSVKSDYIFIRTNFLNSYNV